MGITGGLASHLFAFLIGFGSSSVISLLKLDDKEEWKMDFDINSEKFLKENKIFICAIGLILFN